MNNDFSDQRASFEVLPTSAAEATHEWRLIWDLMYE